MTTSLFLLQERTMQAVVCAWLQSHPYIARYCELLCWSSVLLPAFPQVAGGRQIKASSTNCPQQTHTPVNLCRPDLREQGRDIYYNSHPTHLQTLASKVCHAIFFRMQMVLQLSTNVLLLPQLDPDMKEEFLAASCSQRAPLEVAVNWGDEDFSRSQAKERGSWQLPPDSVHCIKMPME